MKIVLEVIDFISDQTGKIACWLAAVLVAIITYEIFMREVFNLAIPWAYETSMMVGGSMMAFGWAYAYRHHCHIRIDVFYRCLSTRIRAGIDVFGALIYFFPLIFLFSGISVIRAKDAWLTGQVSLWGYWYPPLGPFRTVVAIAFILLAAQGVVQFIRDFYLLVRNKTL